MLTSMAKTPDMRNQQRSVRARELLAQARDDYRTEQWLCCLDRCDLLAAAYGDLAEASEAQNMAGAIRSNPEWMQKTCDSMAVRLGEMYLGLAETWLQKGQPQQAMLTLERVIRTFPGSRQAEAAQFRLNQLQGMPTQRAGIPAKIVRSQKQGAMPVAAPCCLAPLHGYWLLATGYRLLATDCLPTISVNLRN